MISSIFGRTKPVNYILLGLFTLIFLICYHMIAGEARFSFAMLPSVLFTFVLVLFTLVLVEFINRKNALTKGSSYLSYFFLLYLCMFPTIFTDNNVLVAHIFVLLAFRRLISLRSGQDVRMKLFDASLWIFVASLFYGGAAVYLIMVYAAIFLFNVNYYKNLLVPPVAFLTVAILIITYLVVSGESVHWGNYFDLSPTFSFDKYKNIRFVVPLLFITLFGFISGFYYLLQVSARAYKARIPGWLVLISLMLGALVVAMAESANTSELIFISFPLCVVFTRFLERIRRKWIKDLILWVFLGVACSVLFL